MQNVAYRNFGWISDNLGLASSLVRLLPSSWLAAGIIVNKARRETPVTRIYYSRCCSPVRPSAFARSLYFIPVCFKYCRVPGGAFFPPLNRELPGTDGIDRTDIAAGKSECFLSGVCHNGTSTLRMYFARVHNISSAPCNRARIYCNLSSSSTLRAKFDSPSTTGPREMRLARSARRPVRRRRRRADREMRTRS